MSFEFFISKRYLRAKRRQAFISLITMLSIAGISLGVMALIVVIAVMTGAEADLKNRIVGVVSHLVVMQYGGPMTDHEEVKKAVDQIEGVEATTPFIFAQTMIRSSSGVSGAVLRGINPKTSKKVSKFIDKDTVDRLEHTAGMKVYDGAAPGIILGSDLAKTLGVFEGDPVYLISPRGMISPIGHVPSMKRFQVLGFFKSGMFEFDNAYAYIHLRDAQKFMRMGDGVSGLEVRVSNVYSVKDTTEKILAQIGHRYWTRDWIEVNHNLFTALKMEKTVMFIILTLIVLVAAFNVASSLIMMVMEKTRDIAILKAMGATDKSIRKIFVMNGMVIGFIGTMIGNVLGFILCFILKQYEIVELPKGVYYFNKLPVQLEFLDVFVITISALAICFLATLYPARQASRLDPIEAIRYG